MQRKRRWATELFFKEKKRPLPKTRKTTEYWCADHQEGHDLTVYATWIWEKVVKSKRISLDKLVQTTLKRYQPFLESNFLCYRPSIKALFGDCPVKTPQKPEHLAELAKVYGYLG